MYYYQSISVGVVMRAETNTFDNRLIVDVNNGAKVTFSGSCLPNLRVFFFFLLCHCKCYI